jgi:hypothetical protein
MSEIIGEPGSIADRDGNIWDDQGGKLLCGKILLNRDQVAAAERYGWRVVEDRSYAPFVAVAR